MTARRARPLRRWRGWTFFCLKAGLWLRRAACLWIAACHWARRFPSALGSARQFLVFDRPFCEIMSLFRAPHFNHLMHDNLLVGYLAYVLAAQALSHQVSAFHSIACMKLAVVV